MGETPSPQMSGRCPWLNMTPAEQAQIVETGRYTTNNWIYYYLGVTVENRAAATARNGSNIQPVTARPWGRLVRPIR